MRNIFINTKKRFPNFCYFSSLPKAKEQIKKTILYDLHKKKNAIFKIFNGFYLPDEYKDDTLITSHLHTRSKCSIFDYTYRPILKISGADKITFLEKYIGSDIKGLWENECRISFILNENGGILDEIVIILKPEHLLVYLNIQCKDKIYKYLNNKLLENKKLDVKIEEYNSHSSISLQGCKSTDVLNELINDDTNVDEFSFMSSNICKLNNVDDCLLNRYTCTGEDGYDILIPNKHVQAIYECILNNSLVKPGGLAVLNTLRLESGFSVYGKDINENYTPIEANYQWVLGNRRLKELDFNGANIISDQIKNGTKIKRVGIIVNSNIIPKENSKIYLNEKNKENDIGYITSSCFSPMLQKPIAMGYVHTNHSAVNNMVKVECMDKLEEAQITKMPFVPLSV
ncbi:glycine cleavage system T protein, putative aminomethyltransferase, mitochondrial, putative [Plasmodium vinckei vinckei]|uniref:Aminomethyltransferase n=1 Tax=Plasmodium vinckei vinckei TaxID=54757 RepID=A0A449BVR7_PLAVN|nr:glycine cleavage system T protein, putative aminomethyltransferase, mitochondrial, putative [Plasmodium vinckei vinckei]KEG02468.1 glycine cleavage system T protein [Plasmodium vinckei vinckei]VEV57538.1 glycine cleavage system T protein, putative aminomethyltransferase, mitochondrial, putative [Plasmodium vinckei vinckei]